MLSFIAACIAGAAGSCVICHFFGQRVWLKRIKNLERDLQAFSATMNQMAEIQMKSYQKVSGNISEIEERLLDLAIPSEGSNLPLERRRRVVAMAGKGASVDEIAKQASVPRGEAELILSLQKCRSAAASQAHARPGRRSGGRPAPAAEGEVKPHAQA